MKIWQLFVYISFANFIAIKVAGTALAGWSWWWLLMAVVPMFALIYQHLGVL